MSSTTPTPVEKTVPVPRADIPPCFLGRFLRGALAALAVAVFAHGPALHAQDSPDPEGDAASAGAPVTPGSAAGTTVNLAFSGAQIERVLDAISRQTGVNVVARGKVAGQQVSILVRNEPVESALQRLVNQKPDWLLYRPDEAPGTIEIWDQATYKQEVLPRLVRQKVFVPRNITAEEAAKALEGVKTPNIGAIAFDPRSNKVIMTDQPYVLEIAQRLLEQIDVDYITRVFYITNADVNAISEKLNNLKSPAAPPIEVDIRTHQIIVRDRLENLRKMELLIETLDVGPDIRVYDLNNIGVEGEDATALQEALERIITPEAFYQINIRASKLILEDIPEIHEKVEKLLAALDQPIKQVLIQAEIIETEFSEGFTYSFDAVLSQDLFGSVIDGLTGLDGLPFGPGTGDATGFAAGNDSLAGGSGLPPTFGPVPVSTRRGATVDRKDLGFLNFRDEFPIARVGGGGLDARFLTKHAYIALQAAMSDSRTRVLQQPRVLVQNQKSVLLSVGSEIPYFTGGAVYSPINTGTGTVAQSGQPVQQRLDVGLELEMIPVISNNGLVEIEVLLSNSTPIINEDIEFAGQNYTGVGSNDQELETVLVIPSGETRVIGGLITESKRENKSGIPYLSSIPVVGNLFSTVRRPQEDNRRRNLLVFLTPTIVVENPRPPAVYKGRAFEAADAALLPPDATVTDIDIEPAPLGLELPPAMPGKAPYDAMELPAAPNVLLPGVDPLGVMEEPETALPPAPVEPPVDLEPVALDPVPPMTDAGEAPLKRIRVTDRPDTTAQALSRIPAPAGGIGVAGPAGAVSQPGAPVPAPVPVPTAPVAVAPPAGVSVQPGATAALPTPPAVVATNIPGTTPIATPVAPTTVETRF